MGKDWQSQAHVKWECKYHVVILPKYRKRPANRICKLLCAGCMMEAWATRRDRAQGVAVAIRAENPTGGNACGAKAKAA